MLLRRLAKTWVVQRLKYIDLSAVPRWLDPNLSTASRYQHSIAVGKLSLQIRDGTEHERLLLTAAAVLHDVGNGPFPHISDQLMNEMLGFNHEGAVSFAFDNSPTRDSLILKSFGLGLDEVASIVKGEHELSPFVNGDLDLDNADNVHRFMTTLLGKPLGEPSYHPAEIAASFSLEAEEVEVSEGLWRKWLEDRGRVYRYVWGDRLNMVCWTMLGRALRILKEDLTPRFFMMTNREAFGLIRLRLPELANGLKRKEFKLVLDTRYRELTGEARKLSDPTTLRKVEDELCAETGLEEWSTGLTVDQPLVNENPDHWRVYLVVHQGREEPRFLLEDILSSSAVYANED